MKETKGVEHAPPNYAIGASIKESRVGDGVHKVASCHVGLQAIRGLICHFDRVLEHGHREELGRVAGEPQAKGVVHLKRGEIKYFVTMLCPRHVIDYFITSSGLCGVLCFACEKCESNYC